MMNAFRLSIAILGILLSVVAASVSAAYLAFVLFPVLLIVGYVVFWLASSTTLRPQSIGAIGASALAVATAIYMNNHGNWNQPGMSWVLFIALGGIVLLGVNSFAIYVRYVTSTVITLCMGPFLLTSSAVGYWWLLSGDSSRADLYMFRADTLFVGLYSFIGLFLAINRAQQDAGADAANSRPRRSA